MMNGLKVKDFLKIEDDLAEEDWKCGASIELFYELLQTKFSQDEILIALQSVKEMFNRDRKISPNSYSAAKVVDIVLHSLRFQKKVMERSK